MWFLIRSAFWLMIVFASMSWPDYVQRQASSKGQGWPKVDRMLAEAREQTWIAIASTCLGAPIACWRAASRAGEIAPEGKVKSLLSAQTARP